MAEPGTTVAAGMVGISLLGAPIIALGAYPHLGRLLVLSFLAGAGVEVCSMGWNLALAEHVPDEMLSRAYSHDALGSFVAMPVGQIAFGPLAAAFGYVDVPVAAGLTYAVICLTVLLSPAVRGLRRGPAEASLDPATG